METGKKDPPGVSRRQTHMFEHQNGAQAADLDSTRGN